MLTVNFYVHVTVVLKLKMTTVMLMVSVTAMNSTMVWMAMLTQCQIPNFIVTPSSVSTNRDHVPGVHANVIKDLHCMRPICIHILMKLIMDLTLTDLLNVLNTKAMVPTLKMTANGKLSILNIFFNK